MGFSSPKIKPPPPPPPPPTKADASVLEAGEREAAYSSYVSTGSTQGLTRKAKTSKPTLLGGA